MFIFYKTEYMKRSKFILFALFLALVACSKDDEPKDNSINHTYDWIRIKSETLYDYYSLITYKFEYEYDSEGRRISHTTTTDGVLSSQSRDYVYNGKELTFYNDTYSDGVFYSSNKEKVVYCDDWIRIKESISYNSNNLDTTSMEQYEYDSEGREIGHTTTSYGYVIYQSRDYVYNGKEVTFYSDYYSFGVLFSSIKQKRVYCDDSWIRIKTFVSYYPNDLESDRIEYEYDNEGRETGFTRTTDGVLSFQRRDYVYNGKEVTFYNDNYSDGVLTSSLKQKRIYY